MTKRDCRTCVYQELADTSMPCKSCITSWSAGGTWTGYEPAPAAQPVAQEPTSLHRAARAVVNYRPSMSYNESYFGEPAGLFKSLVADLERALPTRPMYAAAPAAAEVQPEEQPMFWVRLRSDGGYDGPIHNDAIDEVRKRSGTWRGLYLEAAPAVARPLTPLTDAQIEQIKAQPKCWEHVGQRIEFRYLPFARAIERAHGIGTTGAGEAA